MLISTVEMIDITSADTSIANDLALVAELHQTTESGCAIEEKLLNSDAVRLMLCVIAIITAIFGSSWVFLRRKSKQWNIQNHNAVLVAYQFTNLCVNLFLGLYGMYHYFMTKPAPSKLLVTQRIVGFEQYSTFAMIQICYNLWSLPVGFFLVEESSTMLFHHVATIISSVISISCTFGFRYHQPFFFGLIEISSVPLAIMNYCKKNKEWEKENCPGLLNLIRKIFAVTFLTIRVIMYTPNIYDVERSVVMILWTSKSLSSQIGLIIFFFASLFISILQYYWGMLIVKGIINAVSGVKFKKVKVE